MASFCVVRRFMTNRTGNIAMSFAIICVPVLIAMGAAIDYIRAVNLHQELQANLDAALVATVKEIGSRDDKALKELLVNWLNAEASSEGSYSIDPSTIIIDRSSHGITAYVTSNIETTFLKVIGRTQIPITVQVSVVGGNDEVTKTAFSMYFVLDRSGSMDENTNTSYTTTCYKNNGKNPYTCTKVYTKMEALKLATASLLNQFVTADPDLKYVRAGAVSYDTIMDAPTPLAWGTSSVATYVNALSSRNSTNSGEAVQMAYNSLMVTGTKSEEYIHQIKNGIKTPSKYIVFMTDGANNISGADAKTKLYCDKARVDKVQVYSIAFMAPLQGQALLKYCATAPSDYFPAENTAQLVAAFKLIGQTAAKKLVRLTN
jgi:Flp pilus assembly protein TadG